MNTAVRSKDISRIPILYSLAFIKNPNEVFQKLWDELPWVDVAGNRIEYYCNDFAAPYTYGAGEYARTYQVQPYHGLILEMREQLEAATGTKFEACFLNGYRTNRDQLTWHADDSDELDDERPIAIISLGSERSIYFAPTDSEGNVTDDVTEVLLQNGSLCLMFPHMQETHKHRIPKAGFECGPRISLTFRGYLPPKKISIGVM